MSAAPGAQPQPLDAAARLRRLRMRCWRRGTREMDLLLGGYADGLGDRLPERADALEALLEVDDPLLYAWITGAAEPSAEHAGLIAEIRAASGPAGAP